MSVIGMMFSSWFISLKSTSNRTGENVYLVPDTKHSMVGISDEAGHSPSIIEGGMLAEVPC